MTELVVDKLCVREGGRLLVEEASFRLGKGDLVVLLGPNGAGKTSLIRAALGLHRTGSGSARLGGINTSSLRPIERARQIAYLPQIRPLAWPSRVRDVVALGRFSHGAAPGRLKPEDAAAVEKAIVACDLTHLAARTTDSLSGGELARTHFARAFAAQAPLLVVDEPTAALDPRHQFRILDLVKDFVEGGGGALVVLHDVQLATRYASRLVWMKDGRILADGPPAATLTEARLRDVYGIRAHINGTRIEIDGAV